MLGGYAMESQLRRISFVIWLFLVTGLRSGYAAAMFISLLYKPPIAPLVYFLSSRNLLYFKSYNWLNVLVLAFVPILLGILRDEIPSSPAQVQPWSRPHPVQVPLLPSSTCRLCSSVLAPPYIRHTRLRLHITDLHEPHISKK